MLKKCVQITSTIKFIQYHFEILQIPLSSTLEYKWEILWIVYLPYYYRHLAKVKYVSCIATERKKYCHLRTNLPNQFLCWWNLQNYLWVHVNFHHHHHQETAVNLFNDFITLQAQAVIFIGFIVCVCMCLGNIV